MKTLLDEALDLLEDREITQSGGCCNDNGCVTCSGGEQSVFVEVNGVARCEYKFVHEETCPWLVLMKKAGRRS